jgi:hypothetical protein
VVDQSMTGKVKITVIATGFDRPANKGLAASAAATPVDLHNYAAWKQEGEQRQAAAGGGSRAMSFARRPVLDLPAAGRHNDASAESSGPGAEFEPVSPLDVPAFLRRQAE